jgi:hypothetical protein
LSMSVELIGWGSWWYERSLTGILSSLDWW